MAIKEQDERARLWIDGSLVIDVWDQTSAVDGGTMLTGSITLDTLNRLAQMMP